jgi:hypothetical protein
MENQKVQLGQIWDVNGEEWFIKAIVGDIARMVPCAHPTYMETSYPVRALHSFTGRYQSGWGSASQGSMHPEDAPSSHQKPLMPLGRIGFYWVDNDGWQWRVFEDRKCVNMGNQREPNRLRKFLETEQALKRIMPGRPEDHYRKPEESEQRAPSVEEFTERAREKMDRALNPRSALPPSPQEGAQMITKGYLSVDLEKEWDGEEDGYAWEKELDTILEPLKLEQKIAVLEATRGAVHPEEIRKKRGRSYSPAKSIVRGFAMAMFHTMLMASVIGCIPLTILAIGLGSSVAGILAGIAWGLTLMADLIWRN